MQITKRIIIGLILCFGLIIQATNVHAIYSPVISKRVGVIRKHVNTARELNGTGSITAAIESVKAQDDERAKDGKARALPVEAALTMPRVFADMFTNLIDAPLDPIYMIFNIIPSTGAVISTCLRNDIWLLEDLRDVVVQEMIKAYLMMDSNNGDLLNNDYEYLKGEISRLKEYGSYPDRFLRDVDGDATISSSEYFFGHPGSVNYYSIQFPISEVDTGFDQKKCVEQCMKRKCNKTCTVDCTVSDEEGANFLEKVFDKCEVIDCDKNCKTSCPTSDFLCEDTCESFAETTTFGCPESGFVEAFEEVGESIKNLKTMSSGSGSDWGSILVMAQANARRRAEEWIKSNQITFTLAGEAGGNPQSLVKGDSFSKFLGQLRTQKKILKNMLGPLTPLFSWSIYSSGEEYGEEISYGCMYYHEDISAFRACTVEQLKDLLICNERENTPVKDNTKEVEVCGEKISIEDENKIDCDKFRKPSEVITSRERVEEYQEQSYRYQKSLIGAERTLKYSTNLNNMSEQGLLKIDTVMWEINKEIGRSFEAEGDDAGKGLPYLYSQLATFIRNHCGGKNCP